MWASAADTESVTVYRSIGPDGVVLFSDAPHPKAEAIAVMPPPLPLQGEVERANQLFEQQLELLEFFETARQARAKEAREQEALDLDYVRTEAALQRAREREQEQSNVEYYPFFPPPFWGAPYPPGRPGHRPPLQHPGEPPPPRPPPPQHVQFPH